MLLFCNAVKEGRSLAQTGRIAKASVSAALLTLVLLRSCPEPPVIQIYSAMTCGGASAAGWQTARVKLTASGNRTEPRPAHRRGDLWGPQVGWQVAALVAVVRRVLLWRLREGWEVHP